MRRRRKRRGRGRGVRCCRCEAGSVYDRRIGGSGEGEGGAGWEDEGNVPFRR